MQKFNAAKHLPELRQLDRYLEENPGCNILHNRRRAVYLINEAKDRSFVENQAAIKMHGKWFIWPQGLVNYVEHQINRTQRQYAA